MGYLADDIIDHLDYLRQVTLLVEAEYILELGTRTGTSTQAFVDAANILNAKVVSVDIDPTVIHLVPERVRSNSHWKFVNKDSLEFVPERNIDVLFIDTSHTYIRTLEELRRYAPGVTRNGVILLHDTISYPEVMKAIEDYMAEKPGVYTLEHRAFCSGLGVLWHTK